MVYLQGGFYGDNVCVLLPTSEERLERMESMVGTLLARVQGLT